MDQMEIVIERAREEDRPRIFELLEQANMHRVPSPEMPAITFENYFVARAGGEIVGFSGYKILSSTEAKTELMVVDQRYRGLGVGYLLQQRRMEDMVSRGVHKLTTNADLPETIAWYQKHFGYREVGKLAKLHEFGDPDIDHWTTLEVDLVAWDAARRGEDKS
jgi:ribosomal-protein-alanine N-acetyltransferase